MNIAENIIAATKKHRADTGLFLEIAVSDRPEPFTCFPSTEAIKQQWCASHIGSGHFILNG